MASFRPERIAEMIHRELALRFRNDIKDPRIVPISFTHISVTKDLRRADISYLPLGGDAVSKDLEEAMGEAAKKLRGPIGRALRLRHAPELAFAVDTHTANAFKLDAILAKTKHDREGREDSDE